MTSEPSTENFGPMTVRWRSGQVTALGKAWTGAAEVQVEITDPDGSTRPARALVYPRLTGMPQVGDRVLLNTGALDRSLGTGGYALVIAVPDRLPPDPPPGPGHLVKARYTPLQPMLLGVDEQESAQHHLLASDADLAGTPVVVADLHSALPAVVAGVRARAGTGVRVAYVMTDGGALPVWFSRNVATLSGAGWLVGTVSVGQAFGGDLEAVTVHTGLLAARLVLGADVVVVAQGPGNLGTGTPWGFSGVAAGEAVNAVAALGGRPVASLRVSGADARDRHVGVSHHSLTAYGKVALAGADVVLPEWAGTVDEGFAGRVRGQVAPLLAPEGRHNLATVDVAEATAGLRQVPVRLSTMGRSLDDDPTPFLAAWAAGWHAANLLNS